MSVDCRGGVSTVCGGTRADWADHNAPLEGSGHWPTTPDQSFRRDFTRER